MKRSLLAILMVMLLAPSVWAVSDLDATKPTNKELISTYPGYERETRAKVNEIIATVVGAPEYIVKSGAYTLVSGDKIAVDTSLAAITITLPATPTAGNYAFVIDAKNTWYLRNVTLGRNGSNIRGAAANLTLSTGPGVLVVYVDSSYGWDVVDLGSPTASDFIIKSGDYTAANGNKLAIDTYLAPVSITLPASPVAGNYVYLVDARGTWYLNAITVKGNGSNINSSASDYVNTTGAAIIATYVDSSRGWVVISLGASTGFGEGIVFLSSIPSDSLYTAVTTYYAASKTLVIDTPVSLSDVAPGGTLTIPANLSVVVLQNGTITLTAGKTLVINGTFTAPLQQVFYSTGTLTFGTGSVNKIETVWFPSNSLTAAYASATNDVEVHVTGASIITQSLEMNKRGVRIQCPGMYSMTSINPTAAQSGAMILYGDNVTNSNSFGLAIDGCDLDGNLVGERTGHATVGIRVRGGVTSSITNNHIRYIAGPAISFDGNYSGTQIMNVYVAHNYIEGDPGYPSITRCFEFIQGTNGNYTIGPNLNNNYCAFPTQHCIYAYQDSTQPLPAVEVSVSNMWCQGGIEAMTNGGLVRAYGYIELSMNGGFVETNDSYPGLYAGDYATINANNIMIGRRPRTDGTGRICLHNSQIYGDDLGYPYLKGHDYCTGRINDNYATWGPPNQPVVATNNEMNIMRRLVKFNTGSTWDDGFGNKWLCTYGGGGADNSTWVPVNTEVVIPLDYTDLGNATTRYQKVSDDNYTAFNLFYGQATGVLKSLAFIPTYGWDNNDTDENATLLQISEVGLDDKYMSRKTEAQLTAGAAFSAATDNNTYLYNGAAVAMFPISYGSESPDHLPVLNAGVAHPIMVKTNANKRVTKWTQGSGYVILTYAPLAQRFWWDH